MYIIIVKTGDTVIARVEVTVLNKHVVAGTHVKTVVTAKYGDIIYSDIL